jgi:tetratricopeptide (TPR) repeat protein
MQPLLILFLFAASKLFSQSADLQRYVAEGDRALSEGRYPDAEQAYEKVRQLSPNTAEVYAKLGLIYFQEGKFAAAAPVLAQAIKLKPGLPNADTLLAMSLAELGRYGEALAGLEKAFRRSADPAVKRMAGLQLARVYTGLRRDEKAVEVALELRRLYPNDAEVLYHAGKLFGNYAYLTMEKLAEVAPESVWRHQAAGEVYESQETWDRAIAEYREVLAASPRRPGTHFRIGRAMLAQARQAKAGVEGAAGAAKEFQLELELDPSNANAAYELGEINRASNRLELARGYFDQAVRSYADFEDAQIGLGRTLLALGKPELALPHLKKAVELNRDNDVAYYAIAQVSRALGDQAGQQKALAEFRRVRQSRAVRAIKDPRREVTRQELDDKAASDPR